MRFFERYRWGRTALLVAVAAVCLGALGLAVRHGWAMRKEAWLYFQPGRHGGDIQRNYYFGTLALRHGWLNLYEDQAELLRQAMAHPDPRRRRELSGPLMNYSPLRTAVFARWAASTGQPQRTPLDRTPRWKENDADDPDFNTWLQTFNTSLALAGAVAAGLLVLTWRPRRGRVVAEWPVESPTPPAGTGRCVWAMVAATIAFLAFWYNPAGLILAHGWPSPNAWVIPFFLWALLLATWEWWFVSGAIIGVGAMFQGQHLLVAPMFVLWPLLALRPMRAVRWTIGFGLGFMSVVAGWMLTLRPDPGQSQRIVNWPAMLWLIGGVAAIAALATVQWMRRRRETAAPDAIEPSPQPSRAEGGEGEEGQGTPLRRRLGLWALRVGLPLIAFVALVWPLMKGAVWSAHARVAVVSLLAAAGVVALVWFKGWRAARWVIPGVIAVQLLLCMPVFGASDAWWEVGFLYGTERHPTMSVGPANNLGALLAQAYGFDSIEEVIWTIEPGALFGLPREPLEITMRVLMLAIYGVTLIAAAGAIALQWRRRDPNFLLAATVPWLLFAMLPPQIHERYLGFAGLAAAVWIRARNGVGWTLLGAFISFVAYAQVGNSAFDFRHYRNLDRPFFDGEFFRLVQRATPDVSWALLLATAMVLFASFTRARSHVRRPAEGAAVEATADAADAPGALPVENLPDESLPAGSVPA